MIKLLYILALLYATAGEVLMAQDSKDLSMLVGTYTDTQSHGIYSFRFDQQTGTHMVLDSLAFVNPSYLAFGPTSKYFYAVKEVNDKTASLSAIGFDEQTGKMTLLNTQLTHGEDPCYVEVTQKAVFTANYSGGSLSVFPLMDDGKLAPTSDLFKGEIGGPDLTRQKFPHVHCVKQMHDGYVLASDFSADRILSFHFNPITRKLKANGIAGMLTRDSGPRHIIASQNGKTVYVMSELSGTITVFKYYAGRLKLLQTILSDSSYARGAADIHLTPDGRFLYASNRLKNDGLSIFRVLNNGKIVKIGYQLTGAHPRNFNITPNGKYLLVACRDSNTIQVYRINKKSGLLLNTGNDIQLPHPVCIQFASNK